MADLVAAPFETTPVVAVRKPPTLALHQREATHAMCANIVAGHTRQLVVIATGGGKTVTFASFPRQLRRHIGRGTGRVLVLAHREDKP
jgi:superfamily II DNA or RNA helicase